MRAVRTRSHAKDKTFALATWLDLTGLAGEANPTNLASVAAARRLRITAKRDGLVVHGLGTLRGVIFDGTSLIVRPWFYDDTLAIWVPHGANLTLTAASTSTTSVTIGNMAGALFYFQIITNTGSVTKLGYDYI